MAWTLDVHLQWISEVKELLGHDLERLDVLEEELKGIFPEGCTIRLVSGGEVPAGTGGVSHDSIEVDTLNELLTQYAATTPAVLDDRWSVYLLFAGFFYEEEDADGVAFHDKGCAIFVGNLRDVRGTGERFRRWTLRTICHELGHLLELGHVDGGGSPIMDGQPSGELERVVFSSASVAFLQGLS